MMTKKLTIHVFSVLIIAFLVGCNGLYTYNKMSSQRTGHYDLQDHSKASAISEFGQKEVFGRNQDNLKRGRYLIESNDVLKIKVYDEEELSMSMRVSDEGVLSYPLIGDVVVKGMTTQEVGKLLEDKLREGYLKDPKVAVRLDIALMREYSDKEIFVLGEVKSPGAIPILGKYISALEAVIIAGGFTDIAAPNRTKIIRVENGVEKNIVINLKKVREGDKSLDIILKNGDVVVVPESLF